MTHALFGERFYSHRIPAWHSIGVVSENGHSAIEALARIGGDVTTTMEPIYVRTGDGFLEVSEFKAALRQPTPDDPTYRVFDVKSAEYVPISMTDVAIVADEYVARPVETLGILGAGERGFMTFRLPEIDVKGDPVEMYLGATYSFTTAASVEVWPLRVVCQNTLRMAQAQARLTYRIVHDSSARTRMGEWLADAYAEAEANVEVISGLLTLLADARATRSSTPKVLEAAYPIPREPLDNAPADVMKARWERFEVRRDRQLVFRSEAKRLFGGDGTGMDLTATKGTLYGLVQAVAEVENYRAGSFKSGREAAAVADDIIFGRRGDVMKRASTAALEIAGRA